jgi:hypothetical protein
MAAKAKEAADQGEVLRYVGVIDVATGKCSVRLFPPQRLHFSIILVFLEFIISMISYCHTPKIARGKRGNPDR